MDVSAAALPAAVNVALAGIGIGLLAAWLDAKRKSRKPELVFTPSPFNDAVLARCPTLHATYSCTPLLTNGHAETILVAKLRRAPGVTYKREILITADGGAVTIDWEHFDDDGKDLPPDAPVLILFPGLTGGSGDSYVQHAVLQARHAGVRAAVFNSRGTADSPVLTPQFYSASFTGDTREVIAHVRSAYPSSTLFAAGWSLGANILVNYLGEQGADTPLEAAVSMCNPFDLTISNRHINEGFNRIYNYNLASSLKRIFMRHQPLWRGYRGTAQPHRVPEVSTIREFDEAITVHSFDWEDVDAYYAGSSSAKRVPRVAIPLLCIQAADDPIAPAEAIPYDAIRANPNCTLAVTPCGGHLGWAAGPGAPFGEPWTDAAVTEWLTAVHGQLLQQRGEGRRAAAGAAAADVGQEQPLPRGVQGPELEPAAAAVRAASGGSGREGGRRDDDDGGNGSNGGGNGGAQQQREQGAPEAVAVGSAAGHSRRSSSFSSSSSSSAFVDVDGHAPEAASSPTSVSSSGSSAAVFASSCGSSPAPSFSSGGEAASPAAAQGRHEEQRQQAAAALPAMQQQQQQQQRDSPPTAVGAPAQRVAEPELAAAAGAASSSLSSSLTASSLDQAQAELVNSLRFAF